MGGQLFDRMFLMGVLLLMVALHAISFNALVSEGLIRGEGAEAVGLVLSMMVLFLMAYGVHVAFGELYKQKVARRNWLFATLPVVGFAALGGWTVYSGSHPREYLWTMVQFGAIVGTLPAIGPLIHTPRIHAAVEGLADAMGGR